MISERMIQTLVVRQNSLSQCCYDDITCYKCNRARSNNKKFSQINNLTKCSIKINENSKFLTTKISESSVSCR